MAVYGVPAVGEMNAMLEAMLEQAQTVKQTHTIEPPLHKSDLSELYDQVAGTPSSDSKKHIIDTAVRDIFNNLLVSRSSLV
jgi:THO complex subunit 1